MATIRTWVQAGMLALCGLTGSVVHGQIYDSERYDFLLQTVTNGLDGPLAMVFLSPEEVLIAEQAGQLRWLVDGDLMAETVIGMPDMVSTSENHARPVLLDLIKHTDYDDQPWLYFSYLTRAGGEYERSLNIARGQFDNGVMSSVEVLFTTRMSGASEQLGGQLTMNSSHYLFITMGDQGNPENAADRQTAAGSVIRLADDGAIPEDNPWAGSEEGLDELYSWGHRHGVGFAIDPETDRLWQVDQRPEGDADRLQLIRAGRFYDWPQAAAGSEQERSKADAVDNQPQPWLEDAVASSLTFYRGDSFSEWSGNAFLSTVSGQRMLRLLATDEGLILQEPLVQEFNTPVRDVITGEDGTLWILTDEENARLMRFVR